MAAPDTQAIRAITHDLARQLVSHVTHYAGELAAIRADTQLTPLERHEREENLHTALEGYAIVRAGIAAADLYALLGIGPEQPTPTIRKG